MTAILRMLGRPLPNPDDPDVDAIARAEADRRLIRQAIRLRKLDEQIDAQLGRRK